MGTSNVKSAFFEPATEQGVHSTFMGLKNSRACDTGDIQIEPIKCMLDSLVPPPTFLINLCLVTGDFPEKIQYTKVSVLCKSRNKNDFSNYHPIAIVLPVIFKGLEKVICKWIISFCHKHSLLGPKQCGFRQGLPSEHTSLAQKEIISKRFQQRKLILGVYIDFSKAFDRIHHEILLAKLEHYIYRSVALNLVKSYLRHRRQCVSYKDKTSSLLETNTGVPQGSVLGPVLFNIYINNIVRVSENAESSVYADDTSLFIQSDDVSYVSILAQSTLEKLQNLWIIRLLMLLKQRMFYTNQQIKLYILV